MKTQTIFEGCDRDNAELIRVMCMSLGTELPALWTDEQVCQFFNTVSEDSPRLYTDMEKADMKYEAQMMEG